MKFEQTLRAQYFGPKEHNTEGKAGVPGLGKEKKNHYEVLGVKRGVSVAVCVKAARKSLREVHPDEHPEDRDDAAKMRYWTQEAAKVIEALEVLGDEGRKAEYNERLQNELFTCIVQ